jgi:ADP-dependent NAD(P)H-hydrate dehydratase / NAD(P)H-hydrate epimerase
MRPLLTAPEMRALDARAIEELGIPGAVLMERAGLAAAGELLVRYPDAADVVLLCGAGGNGGDGFVVARHLLAAGVRPRAFLAGNERRMPAHARRNLEIARRLGIDVREAARAPLQRALRGADVAVDALFGTGFTGAPRPPVDGLLDALAAAAAPTVALDVPSGVDASTGEVAGAAADADLTVAFHAAKVGLVVAPGRFHAGEVVVVDIGIPPSLEVTPGSVELADDADLAAVPAKREWDTKYSAGAVLVVGGAAGFVGAPLMTATAALRAGAGIVWAAVPPAVVPALEARRPEIIVRALPDGLEVAERADALAVGPGLGRSGEALDLARRLAEEAAVPTVLDADALFALAGDLERLRRRRAPAVLTPHEGELARLLEAESGWVKSHRLEAVRRAAERSGQTVLLKGADTLVAAPGGERVVVASAGCPALATAGSGDALTGAVAALLAKGLPPVEAAALAAVAHGRAARLAVEARGPAGIIAGDVIEALPRAFANP